MWDCALQAESDWEWDCRAVTQEAWVLGHTAAQAVSLPDGAPMSHSHETHLSAAASLGGALNVGGSVLQTQPGSSSSGRMRGVVAAMRFRGGGGAGDRRRGDKKRKRDEERKGTYEQGKGSGNRGGNWDGQQGSGNWGGQQGSGNWGGQQGSDNWGGQLPQTSTKWASGGGSQTEARMRDPRWQSYAVEVALRERGGKPFITWNQFAERMADMEQNQFVESVDSVQHRHPPTAPPAAAQAAFYAAAYADGAVRTPSPPARDGAGDNESVY